MDKRKNNGGKREGSGRKSKAEEQNLVEKLTPLEDAGFKALKDGLNDGQSWAVKLFLEYRFGKPHQSKDITTNGNDINISPIEWVE
jgi:hypothetical protein